LQQEEAEGITGVEDWHHQTYKLSVNNHSKASHNPNLNTRPAVEQCSPDTPLKRRNVAMPWRRILPRKAAPTLPSTGAMSLVSVRLPTKENKKKTSQSQTHLGKKKKKKIRRQKQQTKQKKPHETTQTKPAAAVASLALTTHKSFAELFAPTTQDRTAEHSIIVSRPPGRRLTTVHLRAVHRDANRSTQSS
jgi:hypothetical protein